MHLLYELSSYLKNWKPQQNVSDWIRKKVEYYLLCDVIRSIAHAYA